MELAKIFNYNGNEISILKKTDHCLVNATQMAKPFSKTPKDFLRNERIQTFIKAFSIRQNCPIKSLVIVTGKGKEAATWVHEKIALKFAEWLSVDFELWVNDVIEEVLKTGSYNIKHYLLSNPMKWEPAFPDEFFRQVMRIYGLEYDPNKNCPQFVGGFINKFVYSCLDRGLAKELKHLQVTHTNSTDSFALLHQFLTPDGREPLKQHVMTITHFLSASGNIDQFELLYNRAFVHKNQLEMYLR
jgi:hypothetical protein